MKVNGPYYLKGTLKESTIFLNFKTFVAWGKRQILPLIPTPITLLLFHIFLLIFAINGSENLQKYFH